MTFEPHATSLSKANAEILARASEIAYLSPSECAAWANTNGFTGAFDFLDRDGTQGFVAESDDAVVVAFRGTEPAKPIDWFTDARAVPRDWDHGPGEVHDGFSRALQAVWGTAPSSGDVLPRRLVNHGQKTIWITGHSLGGALAELCAARASFANSLPVRGVYTFGQPRVGNKAFADAVSASLGSVIFRFVNDKDIVPRVPLFTMGYRHYGHQTFFDEHGRSSEIQATVETLRMALSLGKRAFNTALLTQVFGLALGAIRDAIDGDATEDDEKDFRDRAIALLTLGVEKIEDHGMAQYRARLQT